MSCDAGKAAEELENELWRTWSGIRVGEWGSSTLTSLHLRHSSFPNSSAALPASQLILQPFCCFIYVTGTSPTSPCKPPMPLWWWCLIYPWWFCILQWLRPAGLYERCKLASNSKGWRPLPQKIWKDPRVASVAVRRVDLASWALRTSPKFTTGVKYQFHQGFWPVQRSTN